MGNSKKRKKQPSNYNQYLAQKRAVLILLFLLMIILSIVSVVAGSSDISIAKVFHSFFGQSTAQIDAIVWNIRLPRIATAIVVGAALALTGCVMQSVLNNPLASSSTLGVSHGASFGATIAIVFIGAGVQHNVTGTGAINISNPYLVTLFAFIGGISSVFIILFLSKLKAISATSMILAGVALSSLFSGATALVQYFADDVVLTTIVYWTFGDLGRASWQEIMIIFIVLIICFFYFYARSWSFNALQNGFETAKGLGINVTALTLTSMILGTLLAATAVSFVGIINFVGLVAPHMIRKFVGNDYRFLIPGSALTGSCVLLLSDLCGRLIVAPAILPIGAITSFLGAPLFLYLIYKKAK